MAAAPTRSVASSSRGRPDCCQVVDRELAMLCCAAISAGVDQYVGFGGCGSRAVLAAATRASIRALCGPYISKIASELRTEFLTLMSFENKTVPPSTA